MKTLIIVFLVHAGILFMNTECRANVFSSSTGHKMTNEYHVSVNGSDANDGSLTNPFKTISAAADVAMPGDIITVHAGVYRGQITPPRGGNSDQERIVYQAAPGEKVEIKGSEVVTGWVKFVPGVWKVTLPNSLMPPADAGL